MHFDWQIAANFDFALKLRNGLALAKSAAGVLMELEAKRYRVVFTRWSGLCCQDFK